MLSASTVIPELKKLKHLDLSKNNIKEMDVLRDLLSDIREKFPNLRTLKLTGNQVASAVGFMGVVRDVLPDFSYDGERDVFVRERH